MKKRVTEGDLVGQGWAIAWKSRTRDDVHMFILGLGLRFCI